VRKTPSGSSFRQGEIEISSIQVSYDEQNKEANFEYALEEYNI
jgi:hypothetical protein